MNSSDDTARALGYPVQAEPRFGPERDDEEKVPRLLDDDLVAEHLATCSELVKAITDDLDQMAADLDDNRLAIASSVAWLVGDSARELQEATTLLRARLTFLAGQGLFPLAFAE